MRLTRCLPAIVAALSACSDVPAPSVQFPMEFRSARSEHMPAVYAPRDLLIDGQKLLTSVPRPIQFFGLPVCQASDLVLVGELGLNVTCDGAGELSFNSSSADPEVVWSMFRHAVVTGGGSVRVLDGVVHVKAGSGRIGVGEGDPPPDAPPGVQRLDGVQAFSTNALPVGIERRLIERSLQSAGQRFFVAPRGLSADAVQGLASDFDIGVSVSDVGGSVFVLGDQAEVNFIQSALQEAENLVVPVPVPALSQSTVEAVSAAYPEVTVRFDEDLNVLWLSGSRFDVADSFRLIRSAVPSRSDYRLEAAFVQSSDAVLSNLDVSFSGVRDVGQGFFVRAGGGVAGMVVSIDALASKGVAVVDSRPRLTVSSGETATFQSGDRVPVLGAIDEEGRQSVVYEDVGTIVRARPVGLGNGRVRVDLSVETSSVSGVGVSGSPTFRKRSVDTTVDVAVGDTVMLSGLDVDQAENSSSRTLGIFPGASKSKTRSKVAFFLRVLPQ